MGAGDCYVAGTGSSHTPTSPARAPPAFDLLDVEGDRRSTDTQAPGGGAEPPGLDEARNDLSKVHRYKVDEGEIFVLYVV